MRTRMSDSDGFLFFFHNWLGKNRWERGKTMSQNSHVHGRSCTTATTTGPNLWLALKNANRLPNSRLPSSGYSTMADQLPLRALTQSLETYSLQAFLEVSSLSTKTYDWMFEGLTRLISKEEERRRLAAYRSLRISMYLFDWKGTRRPAENQRVWRNCIPPEAFDSVDRYHDLFLLSDLFFAKDLWHGLITRLLGFKVHCSTLPFSMRYLST